MQKREQDKVGVTERVQQFQALALSEPQLQASMMPRFCVGIANIEV